VCPDVVCYLTLHGATQHANRFQPLFEKRGGIKCHILGTALLAFFILAGTIPAYAQSCALCYTQAAQSGSAHDRSLEEWKAIAGIGALYHKRNQYKRSEVPAEFEGSW